MPFALEFFYTLANLWLEMNKYLYKCILLVNEFILYFASTIILTLKGGVPLSEF